MSDSTAWKDGFVLTEGIETGDQMNLSGLSNSQRSNRIHEPSMRKPSNSQVNNGRYHSRKNHDSGIRNVTESQMSLDTNHDRQPQQSSLRFPSPFDLNFDDAVGEFPDFIDEQMSSQSNASNAATKGSKNGPLKRRDVQNHQSGQVPSQQLHVASEPNVCSSWQPVEQYTSLGGDGSSTVLTEGDSNANSGTGQQTTNKIILNRFLLGSKVQPFARDEEIVDDDLFKVFDDDIGSNTSKKLQMLQQKAASNSGIAPMPASSDFKMQQLVGALQSQSGTNQSSMVSNNQSTLNSNLSARDFALLRQQEHQEEARMQKLYKVRKPSNEPSRPLSSGEKEGIFDSQFFVPSTMMPPTVLASTMSSSPNKRKPENERSQRKKVRTCSGGVSPQSKLEELFREAGIFGVRRVKADEAEYEVVPSALQLASFGTRVVKAVHTSDEKELSELMQCGLSPNPCNQFRDSILDLVCKRGNIAIFECLTKHGTDLQTMDGFGRTPLHHCCWASSFCRPIVDAILERDPMQLMIEDKRGQTPLEYVRADLASYWIQYLESNLHKYWGKTVPSLASPKAQRPSGTLPDPPNAMPVNLAAMVSSGKLLPAQVIPMIRSRKMKSN